MADRAEPAKARAEEAAKARAEKWKGSFLYRVIDADDACAHVRGLAAKTLPVMASPLLMHARGAAGQLLLYDLVLCSVENLSCILIDAITTMEATELHALQGCAVDPSVPLLNIDLLADNNMRLALVRLQWVRTLAEDALRSTESCGGHLQAACFVAQYSGVVRVDEFLKAQQLDAVADLKTVLHRMVEIAPLVAAATEIAAGVN